MFSPRKRLAATALAAAACALVPAMASAGVVVSASGPSAGTFPVGKKLGDSERIVLRAGDTVTVVDGNGTRVLRGAGTYSLDQQAGPSQRNTLASLTQRNAASRTRTTAIRGENPPKPASVWYVDISRPGTVCLADTALVRLWRPATEGDATYSLSASAGGASGPVDFADGSRLASLDTAALPITDGASFTLSGPDGAVGTLTFAVLGTVAEDTEAFVQQLIEKGCTNQLELLASETMIEEG